MNVDKVTNVEEFVKSQYTKLIKEYNQEISKEEEVKGGEENKNEEQIKQYVNTLYSDIEIAPFVFKDFHFLRYILEAYHNEEIDKGTFIKLTEFIKEYSKNPNQENTLVTKYKTKENDTDTSLELLNYFQEIKSSATTFNPNGNRHEVGAKNFRDGNKEKLTFILNTFCETIITNKLDPKNAIQKEEEKYNFTEIPSSTELRVLFQEFNINNTKLGTKKQKAIKVVCRSKASEDLDKAMQSSDYTDQEKMDVLEIISDFKNTGNDKIQLLYRINIELQSILSRFYKNYHFVLSIKNGQETQIKTALKKKCEDVKDIINKSNLNEANKQNLQNQLNEVTVILTKHKSESTSENLFTLMIQQYERIGNIESQIPHFEKLEYTQNLFTDNKEIKTIFNTRPNTLKLRNIKNLWNMALEMINDGENNPEISNIQRLFNAILSENQSKCANDLYDFVCNYYRIEKASFMQATFTQTYSILQSELANEVDKVKQMQDYNTILIHLTTLAYKYYILNSLAQNRKVLQEIADLEKRGIFIKEDLKKECEALETLAKEHHDKLHFVASFLKVSTDDEYREQDQQKRSINEILEEVSLLSTNSINRVSIRQIGIVDYTANYDATKEYFDLLINKYAILHKYNKELQMLTAYNTTSPLSMGTLNVNFANKCNQYLIQEEESQSRMHNPVNAEQYLIQEEESQSRMHNPVNAESKHIATKKGFWESLCCCLGSKQKKNQVGIVSRYC
jgi:hypothetical protein